MNIHKNTKTRSGFTLIELLTVIAIIGILAGILIPAVGLVRKNAAKATSSSNLRQIAIGYNSFANDGIRFKNIAFTAWDAGKKSANNMQGWAHVVAEFGDLNDASLYFISASSDVASIDPLPSTILTKDGNGKVGPATAWGDASPFISYNAAAAINPNARAVITPLIWTKGIEPNAATWSTGSIRDGEVPADGSPTPIIGSPWEGDGGHIAFLDGHVSFYKTLASGETGDDGNGNQVPVGGLLTGPDGSPVDSISDALGSSASIVRLRSPQP